MVERSEQDRRIDELAQRVDATRAQTNQVREENRRLQTKLDEQASELGRLQGKQSQVASRVEEQREEAGHYEGLRFLLDARAAGVVIAGALMQIGAASCG